MTRYAPIAADHDTRRDRLSWVVSCPSPRHTGVAGLRRGKHRAFTGGSSGADRASHARAGTERSASGSWSHGLSLGAFARSSNGQQTLEAAGRLDPIHVASEPDRFLS